MIDDDRQQSEHEIQNRARNALADEPGCFLFRANVGRGWQGVGKPIKVAHPTVVNMNPGDVLLRSARPFDTGLPPGFSDTFGWYEVEVTPDMVGQRLAVFTAPEFKSLSGRERDAQIAFVQAVNRSGGRAGFARSSEDALSIVRGQHARLTLQAGNAQDRATARRGTGAAKTRPAGWRCDDHREP